MSNEFSPTEHHEKINSLIKRHYELENSINLLRRKCHHEVTKNGIDSLRKTSKMNYYRGTIHNSNPDPLDDESSAICWICGQTFGWYCPNSEDHICNYLQEDRVYDSDYCVHCHQPDERK